MQQHEDNGVCELIVAARVGNLNLCLAKIDQAEFVDGHGKNALMHALEQGHEKVAEALVAKSFLGLVSAFGRTALHFAAANGNVH